MNVLSTKGYVKKFNLNQGAKFSHREFAKQFITDFGTRVANNSGNVDYLKFERSVTEAHNQFDSICNKISGTFDNDSLWKFMYGSSISKIRAFLFPEYERGIRYNAENKGVKTTVELSLFIEALLDSLNTPKRGNKELQKV